MKNGNSYFNKNLETMHQEDIRTLQSERLAACFSRVYESNEIQRNKFHSQGIEPGDIRGPEDLRGMPFMCKEDFRSAYPMGLCCVDKKDIVEIHMSSGSSGTPVVMPYTQSDLDQWAECMARCYIMAGAVKSDVVQITPTFGLFNGGFGMYHGARAAELFIVPASSGNTPRQIRLARDFGTRVLTGVVSYGIRIIEELEKIGEELPDLEIGIFGAETFSESMKSRINSMLGIDSFDIYGMTETGGVGTLGMDCTDHNGIHIWDDHYLIEIIDPESGDLQADGDLGELVVTSLTREALPIIRFRTGDLTRIVSREPCSCGRTHTRIAPITGRVDDMLIVKGVNFFPRQIEQVLMSIPGAGSNYQIIVEDTHGVRDVRINVEAEETVTGYIVEKALKEALGFSPKGDVFPIGSLPRQDGKAKRVFYACEK